MPDTHSPRSAKTAFGRAMAALPASTALSMLAA
jgi:hypothetical protein